MPGIRDKNNNKNNSGVDSASILNDSLLAVIHELGINPSVFIREFKKRSPDLKSTIEFFKSGGISRQTSFKIDKSCMNLPQKRLELSQIKYILQKENAFIMNISEKCYPELLKQIYFPPPLLFYKGPKIRNMKSCIAVVGTRKSTSYGRDAAAYMSHELSKNGITVVSGMASGIDFWAHKAAIKEKGGSLGILGCGINIVYPPENIKLYGEMLENGSIATEFVPGTPPAKKNFPARNRLISGVSMGVVVVEAPEKSGALITAEFALEQDREVFSVPGSIFSSESAGCHELIKNGAKLVNSIDDILNEIQQFCSSKNHNILTLHAEIPGQKTVNENIVFDNPDKRAIYEIIGHKPKTVEEIIWHSKLDISRVLQIISELKLDNIIYEKKLNQFSRIW